MKGSDGGEGVNSEGGGQRMVAVREGREWMLTVWNIK